MKRLAMAMTVAGFFAAPYACTEQAAAPSQHRAPAAATQSTASTVAAPPTSTTNDAASPVSALACGGAKLKVHFYDVAQALSALVDLPDGRRILVDTGDSPKRSGCGEVCTSAHRHLVEGLTTDLAGSPIDLLWITHQHSDHIGGALDILGRFTVKSYVDNGRDLTVTEIRDVRSTAAAQGIPITVVEPGNETLPIQGTNDVRLTAIAPTRWPADCRTDRNECSILLRIDYCASSILFVGDEEIEEERLLDPRGSVTLLQVGHHGSDTSSGAAFVAKVQPKYAVISAGKPGEGTNKTYCHPRASTVRALTQSLGGASSKSIRAFDASIDCRKATDANWIDVQASDHLWATERDGDVVLSTTGDGVFIRER